VSLTYLITGVSGFAGAHLVDALGGEARIVGIDLAPPPAGRLHRIEYHQGEITDFEFVRSVAAAARPDRVVHLAALTFGQPSEPGDQRFLEVNVQGTRVLLEALLAADLKPRILVAGSSAVYGAVPEDPITESAPLRPQTLYAASKACQELIALTYHRACEMEVVVTRAFNHTGPREHPHFAASTFARQIAEAETGDREPVVRVGNLEAYRDFTDVRDVVRAYLAVLERGEAGSVYNVCSGVARRIGDLLDHLVGMARVPVRVERDPARLAPADVPYQRGSHDRLTAATGWRPGITLAASLADLLNYWRERTGPGPEIRASGPKRGAESGAGSGAGSKEA
jgi:GDP-4-dehydro-6-deoxy-D-mannose reductase